jgi:hypothetical protein
MKLKFRRYNEKNVRKKKFIKKKKIWKYKEKSI